MTYEDAIKEMYSKTAGSAHPHKMTMQDMIVIVMTFESVRVTTCSVAAATWRTYVPFTLPQYDVIIDRSAHAVYLLALVPRCGP
jgi:hypothetical protein